MKICVALTGTWHDVAPSRAVAFVDDSMTRREFRYLIDHSDLVMLANVLANVDRSNRISSYGHSFGAGAHGRVTVNEVIGAPYIHPFQDSPLNSSDDRVFCFRCHYDSMYG